MSQFIRSFALVITIISITATIAFVSVRNWSLSKTFEPPLSSPLVESWLETRTPRRSPRVVAWMGDTTAAKGSLAAIQSASRLGGWIWLDLRPTKDDIWVALSDVFLERASNLQGLSGLKSWPELQAAQLKRGDGTLSALPEERIASLNDIIAQLPSQTFVLNFKEYRPGDDVKIEKLIRNLRLSEKVIIQSDVQGLLTDLRTINPKLVFGTGLAQLAKLRALLSMNLEGLLPLKGDVVFALSTPEHAIPDLMKEVHRRARPLIAGPAKNFEQELAWADANVDGILTPDPARLCAELNSRALRQQKIESCAKTSE